MSPRADDGPLLVFGPRSTTYDFGPRHPLTPRRFGPGIDLLRAVGASPGLPPEPIPDALLELVHDPAYVAAVRRLSADTTGRPAHGIGPGDDPPFPGMHEAAAAVAGGSLAAMEALLAGEVSHAFHPGGGLHHAMRDRAAGFCIYDDPALAIARARLAGCRVLYVDLDVHHGDGVEAIHRDDPGVMTVSWHESGRYLFPGTGAADVVGSDRAAGTVVNVPLDPFTGEAGWLAAVETLLPLLAVSFGPDLVVSQHGADTHAWDPLAHLRVTTTAMGRAARLVDAVAHRSAPGGRWLATGGGGYAPYRVVPRAWALTWLAGAHREAPETTPRAWRERWAADAERFEGAPPPDRLDDAARAGMPDDEAGRVADRLALRTAAAARAALVPALVLAAADRGWGGPGWPVTDGGSGVGDEMPLVLDHAPGGVSAPARSGQDRLLATDGIEIGELGPEELDRLRLAPRTIAPFDLRDARRIVRGAVAGGAVVVGAREGDRLVGLGIIDVGDPADTDPDASAGRHSGAGGRSPGGRLVALGVAPDRRGAGLGRALLAALVAAADGRGIRPIRADVTVAERDPVEPEPIAIRREVARRLLAGAGFRVGSLAGAAAAVDREGITATRD